MSTASSDPEFTGGGERRRRRSLRGDVGTTGARFGSPAVRRSLDDGAPEQPKPPRRRRSLRGEVGTTGARFGSAALRRSLDEQDDHPEDPVERTAPFDGHFDEPEPEHGHEHGHRPEDRQHRDGQPEPEPAEEEFSGPLVRPYAWTGGRTASHYDLRLETLLSLEENGIAIAMRDTSREQRSIVEMCANPRSVAEVSALLAVPLGVVRVLISDLISMGVVAVHDNAAAPSGPDLVLMERVLAGLHKL